MVKDWSPINLSKNSKIKARIGWQGLTTAEYLDEGYAYLMMSLIIWDCTYHKIPMKST